MLTAPPQKMGEKLRLLSLLTPALSEALASGSGIVVNQFAITHSETACRIGQDISGMNE